jgi:hypothetical protein
LLECCAARSRRSARCPRTRPPAGAGTSW